MYDIGEGTASVAFFLRILANNDALVILLEEVEDGEVFIGLLSVRSV